MSDHGFLGVCSSAAGLLLRGDGADDGEGGLLAVAGSSYRGGHSPLRLQQQQQQLSMVVKPQLSALSSASSSASTVLLTHHQQQQPVPRFHYPSPHLTVTQLPASLMA